MPRLRRVVNTHLHSDHCGGNALLARHTRCEVVIPEGNSYGVRNWDHRFLSFEATGQHCERFDFTDTISAGDVLTLGGQEWEALAAPGHDVDSLMFHCEDEGILISGDAIWEDGCGAMFPTANPKTLDEDFSAAFETLELVESLDLRIIVPGHGAPFSDQVGALERVRSRLKRLAADPTSATRGTARRCCSSTGCSTIGACRSRRSTRCSATCRRSRTRTATSGCRPTCWPTARWRRW